MSVQALKLVICADFVNASRLLAIWAELASIIRLNTWEKPVRPSFIISVCVAPLVVDGRELLDSYDLGRTSPGWVNIG